MRNRLALALLAAALPFAASAATAPALPPGGSADAEVSTNLVLRQDAGRVREFSLRLAFVGTASNNVEVVFGCDADGDGELSFDESALRLGWDCGRYFVERVPTGERYEETNVGTAGLNRLLDWRCVLRRDVPESLAVATEVGAGFARLTADPPAWLYDRNWNLVRLTARGTDVQNERFEYAVTGRGVVVILR